MKWPWLLLSLGGVATGIAFVSPGLAADIVNPILTFIWGWISWIFDAQSLLAHGMEFTGEFFAFAASFLPPGASDAMQASADIMQNDDAKIIGQAGIFMLDQVCVASVVVLLFVSDLGVYFAAISLRMTVWLIRWIPQMGGEK